MPLHDRTRREFLSAAARAGVLLACGSSLSQAGLLERFLGDQAGGGPPPNPLDLLIKGAPKGRFWISTATAKAAADCAVCHTPGEVPTDAKPTHTGVTVRCGLCARNCVMAEGERGMCRARVNAGGELKSLVYGRPMSMHIDPIEKKPFYHFLPGSAALSMATSGCPLRCKFCQNWEISQARAEDYDTPFVPPVGIVNLAVTRKSPVIAYTYNEPTVFTEYLTDIAREGRKQGRRSVLVSCGYMNEAPLAEMCEVLDGIKIDLKGFSQEFYRNACSAELKPVLRSIKQVAKSGTHLEIVNLVVPTLNDSVKMLTELAKWVVGEVGPDVPVHFTRFHPDYQLLNLPRTPVATLERAYEIAKTQGIHYPFVGNVPGHPGNNTYCPKCSKPVIARTGFFLKAVNLKHGRCGVCGEPIAGVWE
jgi:pyruvate formate lyase activating enzyme